MLNAKKGRLLISEPTLTDPVFFKSVVLLTHHSDEESIGLVLNQPTKIHLNEILNNIPLSDFPVYIGGPVEKNSIHFIHTLGDLIPNTEKVIDGLYWGGDFDTVLSLMSKNEITKMIFVFLQVILVGEKINSMKKLEKMDGLLTMQIKIFACNTLTLHFGLI